MTKLVFLLLISLSSFAQTDGTVSTLGGIISYRTFGVGKQLLIINGGPGMNSNGFVPLAEKLSENNMAIIYDQRGTGKSTLKKIDKSTITMDLMVSDIETLRKHLKIEKWTILGHSFGGMLASYYSTIHPERIEKLIMSSSGGIDLGLLSNGSLVTSKLTESQRDSLDYWNRKINSGDSTMAARLGRGRALAPAYVYDKKNIHIIVQRLTESNMSVNALVWQDLNRIKFDCAAKLADFNQRVLILQGKNDILEMSIAEKIHKAFRNSTLVILDKCAHYGWLDRPDQYFAEIDNFLKS